MIDEDAFGEGNGTLLQYSCLENPMGGGAISGFQTASYSWKFSCLIGKLEIQSENQFDS